MAACPVISTSREGRWSPWQIWLSHWESCFGQSARKFGDSVQRARIFLAIAALSGYLDGTNWRPTPDNFRGSDEPTHGNLRQRVADRARFSSIWHRAGTFGSLYQLYRTAPSQVWAAYVHDDWLEARITFGWVGFSAIVAMLMMVFARSLGTGGLDLPFEFPALGTLSLVGCLLHGKFDFPFQIYSIVLLFLLLSAVQFSMTPCRESAS
jgi:hypothetical protein